MDILDGVFLELLKQFGGVTVVTMAATEWLSPGFSGNWKRIAAIFWSMFFSYVAYLIGAIELPELVTDQPEARYIVLVGCAIASASLAFGGHEIYERTLGKKKKPQSRLPR